MSTEYTRNVGLAKPNFNVIGWHDDVNANFDVLDALFTVMGIPLYARGVWQNNTAYEVGARVVDPDDNSLWYCEVDHTSPLSGTFAEARIADPSNWSSVTGTVRARGAWQASTDYAANDYVYFANRYAVATQSFTSSDSPLTDVSNGNLIVLIDLSTTITNMGNAVTAAEDAQLAAENAAAAAAISEGNASDSEIAAASSADVLSNLYSEFAGGSSGQILAKQSGTDYDYTWVTVTGGGDMIAGIYDPQAIGSDAFARANHTGEQAISTITGLATTLNGLVPATRTVTSGAGLTGGGNLSANRTLAVNFGTTAGTVMEGNDSRVVNAVPVGAIVDFAGTTEPDGWMFCDGRAISRSTYATLFARLNTLHGEGDGSTTFNIPDARGRVTAGRDNMGGTAVNRLTSSTVLPNGQTVGAVGGTQQHVLTTNEMPAHNHTGTTASAGSHTHNILASTGSNNGSADRALRGYSSQASGSFATSAAGNHAHSFTTANRGGDAPHNNLQPTIVMNKIIKVL